MRRLEQTRFAIIGAGGLGGPVAYALAGAGVGKLLLCDYDLVDLSNLQRQIQFDTTDIGENKVYALADELERRAYPRERIEFVDEAFENNSAEWILDHADVVIDGTDNFPAKFLINDRCIAAGLPFVIGAVLRYGGQVMPVRPGHGPCYRCLFEAPPTGDDPLSCSDAGVLGAVVGFIGGQVARAALELALAPRDELGRQPPAGVVPGELQVYDDLRRSTQPRRVRFNARGDCPACGHLTRKIDSFERNDAPEETL